MTYISKRTILEEFVNSYLWRNFFDVRIRNHPTTSKNDNGESYIPKSAGNEFFSPSCFSYTNEPENKAEIRFEKETRNSILFFHVFSSFENLKKKLFQPKVHEMVVDYWQRSNSWTFLIAQALLQMQGPHVTKKKERILVNDLIGRESMAYQIV